MIKAKELIVSLSNILRVIFLLGIFFYIGSILFGIINLITGGWPNGDPAGISFDLIAYVDVATTYSFTSGGQFADVASLSVSLDKFLSSDIKYRIFGYFDNIIMYGLLLLMLKKLVDIFTSLSESVKTAQFFAIENYDRIRNIVLLSIAFHVYSMLKSIGVSWFLLEEFSIMSKSVSYYADFGHLYSVFNILIIFVIAEVYKAGIQLKEESELTI